MRRRSWQGGYKPGLLLVLVLAGCLGTCMWHRAVMLTDGSTDARSEERPTNRTDDGSSRADGSDVSEGHGDQDESDTQALGAQDSTKAVGNGISVSVQAGGVEQVAIHLLTSYRDAQNCVLVSSGYLDLLGLVWGCVVQGDGWVEVCMVAEDQTEDSCKVSVLHMEPSELAEVFGEDDTE